MSATWRAIKRCTKTKTKKWKKEKKINRNCCVCIDVQLSSESTSCIQFSGIERIYLLPSLFEWSALIYWFSRAVAQQACINDVHCYVFTLQFVCNDEKKKKKSAHTNEKWCGRARVKKSARFKTITQLYHSIETNSRSHLALQCVTSIQWAWHLVANRNCKQTHCLRCTESKWFSTM